MSCSGHNATAPRTPGTRTRQIKSFVKRLTVELLPRHHSVSRHHLRRLLCTSLGDHPQRAQARAAETPACVLHPCPFHSRPRHSSPSWKKKNPEISLNKVGLRSYLSPISSQYHQQRPQQTEAGPEPRLLAQARGLYCP